MKVAYLAPLVLALAACDGWNTDAVGPEPQYVAPTPTHASSSADWLGEPIVIGNVNGNVEVTGVPGATRIEVDAYPAALAHNQADADAAIADIAAQIAVSKLDNGFHAECPSAMSDHGSAQIAGTGCARLVVRVPTGSTAQPVTLSVSAKFGGVQIDGVVGSVVAYASFDVHASVTPIKDSNVSLANGNDSTNLTCPLVLVIPTAFETNSILVESQHASGRVITDFPELMVTSCSRPTNTLQTIYPGDGPFPCISSAASHGQGIDLAARIEVLAGQGDAYLVHDAASAPAWSNGRCDR